MRGILISPSSEVISQFQNAIVPHADLRLVKSFDDYPDSDALSRAVRAWVPEVIFLVIDDLTTAEDISRRLERESSTVHRVAIHGSQETDVYRRVLQLRMSELLSPPFEDQEFSRVLRSLEAHLEIRPTPRSCEP